MTDEKAPDPIHAASDPVQGTPVIELEAPLPVTGRRRRPPEEAPRESHYVRKGVFTLCLGGAVISTFYSSYVVVHNNPELLLNIFSILALITVASVSFGLFVFEKEKINLDTKTGLFNTLMQPLRGLRARYSKTLHHTVIASGICVAMAGFALWLGPYHVHQFDVFCPEEATIQWTDWIGHERGKCSVVKRISTWRLSAFDAELIDTNGKHEGTCTSSNDVLRCEPGTTIATNHVLLVRTGGQEFARNIEYGFKTELEKRQRDFVVDVVSAPSDATDRDGWKTLAEDVEKRRKAVSYAYYVTVGTQAAVWFNKLAKAKKLPHVFLGVTDPVDAGLVAGIDAKRDGRLLWGVQYGDGPSRMVGLTRMVFTTEPLAFAYEADRDTTNNVRFPQDLSFANKLPAGVAKLELHRGFTVDDLSIPKAVYLAWYTIEERIGETDPASIAIISERTIVSSTEANVRNGLAAVGVGANDIAIGRAGAEFVSNMIDTKNVGFDTAPIEVSPLRLFINCSRARTSAIPITTAAMASASSLYDCAENLRVPQPNGVKQDLVTPGGRKAQPTPSIAPSDAGVSIPVDAPSPMAPPADAANVVPPLDAPLDAPTIDASLLDGSTIDASP